MSASSQRDPWNRRHATRRNHVAVQCEALDVFEDFIPRCGRALDLACGAGGNALWLARRGLTVDALDLSTVAIEQLRLAATGLRVNAQVADLAVRDLGERTYDFVIASRFLLRALCPRIETALVPGGLLLYQTFVGDYNGVGPRRATFRLAPGELPALFSNLSPVAYREDPDSGPLAGYATLLARAARND